MGKRRTYLHFKSTDKINLAALSNRLNKLLLKAKIISNSNKNRICNLFRILESSDYKTMAKVEVVLKEVNGSQVFFRLIYSYCEFSSSILRHNSLHQCIDFILKRLQIVSTLFNRSKHMTTNPYNCSAFDVRVQRETFVLRRVCYYPRQVSVHNYRVYFVSTLFNKRGVL